MRPASIEFQQDHMVVRLDGLHSIAAMRRAVTVPYSTIRNAEIASPDWPGLVDHVHLGTFVPGRHARGTFIEWNGRRRFLDLGPGSSGALRIELQDHAEFDELCLDVPEPGLVLDEVSKHSTIAPHIPPVYE